MHIVFTTLAFNQTRYFVALCKELEKQGVKTSIISFHEDSNSFIERNGVKCFNVFSLARGETDFFENTEAAFGKIMRQYSIDCPNILLSHEKVSFNLSRDNQLKLKFVRYFRAVDAVLSLLKAEYQSQLAVFQELGGFASILATFHVAQAKKIDHFFMEPSFFRGRMFFVKDSLLAHKPQNTLLPPSVDVSNYIKQTLAGRQIVIPKKDASHYQHPLFKILSRHNVRRFFEKLFSKYFLRREEEFNKIGSFVTRHIKMLINRLRLAKFYKKLPKAKFIYYPFHVPMDVALTIRAPLFLDQYSLIDYISRNIPIDYTLVIKEHPAMIGAVSYHRLRELLQRNQNIVLLHPDINNHEVMDKMDLLITVNSKTGAESLMRGKRIICLGDAFYNQSQLVNYVKNISNLYTAINLALSKPEPSETETLSFFQNIWNESFPGELYFCRDNNVSDSVKSILKCVGVLA